MADLGRLVVEMEGERPVIQELALGVEIDVFPDPVPAEIVIPVISQAAIQRRKIPPGWKVW